jgi:hypothetical protein
MPRLMAGKRATGSEIATMTLRARTARTCEFCRTVYRRATYATACMLIHIEAD